MRRWSEILEQKREEVTKALERSFRDAVDCRHLQYITEVYQDGTVRRWTCPAGSNSFSADSWNGKSIEVGRFCFQNMDTEATEEDFRRHMTEDEQNEAEMLAEENGMTFVGFIHIAGYIYKSRFYSDLIGKVESEWLEWYKDEYAYSEAEKTLDNTIIMESSQEEYKERNGEE